ncbi:CLUMA_CG004267, isoform A [Clunio marinus]|uniref:Protein adenylyltransferase Fic n=1 Tax=Clunio marinus TaxID=568069 RepID=A0A1J1HT59_9DIPT|nr:CLUMA_CG004267, isoform A [Clunio marinus]
MKMIETLNENTIPIRKKPIVIAIAVCTISILISLFIHNYLRNKSQKFLLPRDSDIRIHYDPIGIKIVDKKPKKAPVEENIVEAEINLKAALELKRTGKYEKALKVFQHSLALSPNHPSILTEYGIFLELYRHDIIQADSFYFRALTYDPNYQRALTQRQRTANVVQGIDEERLRRLDEKRDLLSQVDTNSAAMKRATKEAYILHIYHSVGIEGNSMTLSETRSVLETRMAVSGRSVDEHNEVLGLDSAMKYVNASLVKNNYITLEDILEIHKRVLGHVDPIEGGIFRRTQVYVGNHIPPKPQEVQILMDTFVEWMNSKEASELHPIKLAAIAHYKLVHIHPFTDGNGRTSRLLMNTILMRFGFPPVVIQKQQRLQYYNYLQMANEGDIRPFIRFVAEATEKTLDLYLWATSELPYQVPLLAQAETIEAHSPTISSGLEDDLSGSGGDGDAIRL